MDYITDARIDAIEDRTGSALRKEKKVTIVIGPDKWGTQTPWEGCLNGHFFRIRRGEPVQVPASIAELIRENHQVQQLSARQLKAYRDGSGKRLS